MLIMYAVLSPLLGLLFPFFKEMDEAIFVNFVPTEATPQKRTNRVKEAKGRARQKRQVFS